MTNLDSSAGAPASGAGQDGTTPTPKEMFSEVKQATQDQVQGLTSKVQDKAKEQVSQKKETASRTVQDFADAIRRAGDELADRDQSAVGRVVKQAADGLEGFSRSLADKRPEELLHGVRTFGRTNPVAFIGASVLVGLAIGRFARSSAQHQSSGGASAPTPPTVGGTNTETDADAAAPWSSTQADAATTGGDLGGSSLQDGMSSAVQGAEI